MQEYAIVLWWSDWKLLYSKLFNIIKKGLGVVTTFTEKEY